MTLHAYASLAHYWAHLAPVWAALPADVRGLAWSARSSQQWGHRPGARELNATRHDPVLVASLADYQQMAPRPVVYVEHGAGQCYPADPISAALGSYAGGRGLDRVVLFVCPSELVAARWAARYFPDAAAVAVGCPRLDPWHAKQAQARSWPDSESNGPTVAVTWHWDAGLIPETRSAWHHYRRHLPALQAAVTALGGLLVGHAHPRATADVRALYERLGIPWWPLADVYDRASLLVADNTSALPEFASLGRPVLWLSAPWYRRHVHHGGRFWEWPQGQVTCDDPAGLPGAVAEALADPPRVQANRAAMVRSVYAHTDGHAATRAAAAILEVLGEPESEGPAAVPAG